MIATEQASSSSAGEAKRADEHEIKNSAAKRAGACSQAVGRAVQDVWLSPR